MTRKEFFLEQWGELEVEDKIRLVNEHLENSNNYDDTIYTFDESFWETWGCTVDEAIRAWSYGGKKRVLEDGTEKWEENRYMDPYIRFNGYANLVTMDEYEAEEYCEMWRDEVYDDDNWEDVIDKDDWDYKPWATEVLTSRFPDISEEVIEKFLDETHLYGVWEMDDDELVDEFNDFLSNEDENGEEDE